MKERERKKKKTQRKLLSNSDGLFLLSYALDQTNKKKNTVFNPYFNIISNFSNSDTKRINHVFSKLTLISNYFIPANIENIVNKTNCSR